MKVVGISDISSSEAKLKRFADLCEKIGAKPGKNRAALFRAMKLLGIESTKVVERHVEILKKINLMRNLGEVYTLTGDGKALSQLASERADIHSLSSEERAFFFKTLMTSIAKRQLIEFLLSVKEEITGLRKDVILRFFGTDFAHSLWKKEIVDKNLMKLRSNEREMPRFFEHKFRCMETWLRDISLVAKSGDKILLTDGATTILPELQASSGTDIYHINAKLYYQNANDFDFSRDRKVYVPLFRQAFSHFQFDTGASDLRAIRPYVCTKLLKAGLILEGKEFDETVRMLSTERIIRSVILGRDGKPQSITLYMSV